MNKNIFPYQEFDCDIFVGDYTEYAKSHPERAGVGVVFADKPFSDLNTLHIINCRRILTAIVNFEKCEYLLKNEKGEQVKQCEGLCFASRAKKHGWVLLIEMKYCSDKNIGKNVDAAKFQLEKSLDYLRHTINAIEENDRVYWVLAIPDHSELEPFNSFVYSQDDLLELRERLGVVLFFRQNELEIHTDAHLMIPKVKSL